jgi:hypothetical protein
MPQIDSPELVAEKIIELINSEEPEITLWTSFCEYL